MLQQLEEEGHDVHIKHGVMRIRDEQRCLLARVWCSPTQVYTIRLDIARPICLAARRADKAWRWHQRFGHISFQALQKLQNGDMVRGLPRIDHVDQVCDNCLAGKQRRSSFQVQARVRAVDILDQVHGNIYGLITPTTPSCSRYFLLLVDDMSRYMWLCLLASKDQAPAAIQRFKGAAEVESDRKLKVLRTDRGGEFNSVEFGAYCAEEGIQRQLTAPLLSTIQWGCGASQSDGGGHGEEHDEGEGVAGDVLGRGCQHGGVHPQQIVYT